MIEKFFSIPKILRLIILLLFLAIICALGLLTYYSGIGIALIILYYLKSGFTFWCLVDASSVSRAVTVLLTAFSLKLLFILVSMLSEKQSYWKRSEAKELIEKLIYNDWEINKYFFFLLKKEVDFFGRLDSEEFSKHLVVFLTALLVLLLG